MSGTSIRRPHSGEGALWWAVATVSCAIGIGLAGLELGTGGLLISWVFSTVITMCMVLMVRGPRFPHTSWIRLTVLGGLMSTAAVGLASGLGIVGLVWILAIAATSRSGRWLLRDWLVENRRRKGTEVTATREPTIVNAASAPAPDLSAATIQSLDDEALCLAWRRSYLQLQRSRSTSAQIVCVQQRQRLLDELERRHPDGLAAWFASGCRAAGNPGPFLARSTAPESTGSTGDDDPPEPDGDARSRRTS